MAVLFLFIMASLALATASSRQFHFVYELKTHKEARSYCRQHYTDLATVENMEDALTLDKMVDRSRLLNPDGKHYRAWIGLYDDINTWGWSLSDPAYYSVGQENYRNWVHWEPGNQGANQFCARMDSDGLWRDVRCGIRYTAICVNLTGSSQETLVRTTATFTWEEAQHYCRLHHTDLASVRDAAQNTQIQTLVPSGQVWIGLRRQPWRWLDGTNATFFYWKTQDLVEPNNSNLDEYCVAAHFDYTGTWEDWNCDYKKAFICYNWAVKKYRIKLHLKTTSANPDDTMVKEQVLRKVKQYIEKENATELLNLNWAEDTNGKVFNKIATTSKEETCTVN